MRGADPERRLRRVAAAAFWLLAGPGLGLAALAAWVLGRHAVPCWPDPMRGARCLLMLGAGLACWTVAAAALASGAWQWARTTRRLAGQAVRPDLATPLPAQSLDLSGRLAVVDDGAPWALTHGFLRPRVAVSAGLVAVLTDEELAAVLAHEACHCVCRDPLRLALARVAATVLGFVPAARRLLVAYTTAAELAADAYALQRVGRRPLAQALWKLRAAATPGRSVPFAPTPSLLRRRVEQIERYPQAIPGPWPHWRDVIATAAGAGTAAAWLLSCLHG
jgi:Zn-dependent protease with chaperone function